MTSHLSGMPSFLCCVHPARVWRQDAKAQAVYSPSGCLRMQIRFEPQSALDPPLQHKTQKKDSRNIYAKVQESLLRGFVACGLLRAPTPAAQALALAHGTHDPDWCCLGPLALAVNVHPLHELALLLHVLVEQR